MMTHTREVWIPDADRKDYLLTLPVGADGVHRTVSCYATKREARFLTAMLAFADATLINKCIEYAASDAG